MSSPNSENVRGLWNYMSRRYGTRIIDKADALEMRLVAWFLKRIGVLDEEAFLESFTTTIGKRIYTPYSVGESRRGHSLWSQLVTCVHEHQHVEQLKREGMLRFFSRYLASKAARAAYEAEAYTCNLELHFWRTGKILSPKRLASRLLDYGCRPADVEVTHKTLIAAARTIRAGGIITSASKIAIAWLEEYAPELKHHP